MALGVSDISHRDLTVPCGTACRPVRDVRGRVCRQDNPLERAFYKGGVDIEVHEVCMAEHFLCQWQGGLHTFDHEFMQAAPHAFDRFFAGWLPDDQFSDHGVIVGTDGVAFVDVRIESHAWSAWEAKFGDGSRAASEAIVGVFGIDAEFNGTPGMRNIGLSEGQFFAGGDEDLLLDQVDTRDKFRDGMFHLDTCVDFDEVEVEVFIDDKFAGSGVCVAGFFDQFDGAITDSLADIFWKFWCRAFFNQFLMATLHRAVAFPEVHDVSVVVREDLNFDVAGSFDVFFEIDAGVFEGLFGFSTGGSEPGTERNLIAGDAHSLATTAGSGFDQDWVTDSVCDLNGVFHIADQTVTAWHAGDAGFHGDFAGTDFVAQLLHGFDRWPDEFDVATAADFREVCVFGEKSVARMHGLDIPDFCRTDDAFDLQVAFQGLWRPDAPGLVRQFQVVRSFVGFAVDSHRFDTKFTTGSNNSKSNFAAIGYQNSLKHESAQ